jgi:hypothetical protein
MLLSLLSSETCECLLCKLLLCSEVIRAARVHVGIGHRRHDLSFPSPDISLTPKHFS